MDNKLKPWKIVFLLFLIVASIYVINNQIPYQSDSGRIFGTYYNITYKAKDNLHTQIKEVLLRVDNSLSPFNRNSIITKINNNKEVEPDSMFLQVFDLAQEISVKTDGAFDITVAPLVNAWGFGFKNGTPTDTLTIENLRKTVGYTTVRNENGRIIKKDSATMLDCSAIAKGYGCDAVATMLRKQGVTDFLVEIGGEVAAQGNNKQGNKWSIGVNKPVDDATQSNNELQEVLHISGKCMATSGNYRNFRYENGKKVSHTIDPRTGYPVQHSLLSATVIANDCATADAYATAFMVTGLERAMEICKQNKEIDALFIYADSNGTIKTAETENLKNYR